MFSISFAILGPTPESAVTGENRGNRISGRTGGLAIGKG
jgi:hypothetical protein